eukprot:3591539-Pyramimonas_sp.AAC.1
MVTPGGRVAGGVLGTVPGQVQEIGFAELYALLVVLREADGDLEIIADCRNVVDDFEKGELWCTSPESRYAELWSEVWTRAHDMPGTLALRWTRAHTSWAVAEAAG